VTIHGSGFCLHGARLSRKAWLFSVFYLLLAGEETWLCIALYHFILLFDGGGDEGEATCVKRSMACLF
jgi:hypothetical protein